MSIATEENIKSLHDTVFAKLKENFGDAIIASEIDYDFPVFNVEREKIYDVLKFLKEDAELNFHFLTSMCAMHFPERHGKEFGMVYQLHNMPKNFRIRIKTAIPGNDLEVPTVTTLWPTPTGWNARNTIFSE